MKFVPTTISLLILFFFCEINAQEKLPLDHSVYDSWKSVTNISISNNGELVAYEIVPQEGDGNLFLYEENNSHYSTLPRGYKPILSSNSNMLIYRIKPQFDTVRSAKLKKVKKDKLPQDSLGMFIPSTGAIIKYADVKSINVPGENSDWIAFTLKMKPKKKDTTASDTIASKKASKKKKDKKKDKKKVMLLVLTNPITGDSISYDNVTKYSMSKNGQLCAFIQVKGDSVDSIQVSCYNTLKKEYTSVFSKNVF